MSDKEILDHQIGTTALKDMSALTFLQFVARKLNETPAYSAAATELRMYVQSPPMARNLPDDEKVRLARKLMSLGITL